MSKINQKEHDFLSEAEQIKVMGGATESSPIESGITIYIFRGCGWKDCRRFCSAGPSTLNPR